MDVPQARLDLRRIAGGHGPGLALAAAIIVAVAGPARGQTFPTGPGPYDPAVARVAEARGFPTGAGFSSGADIVRVLERIAATSPRVLLERYGRTTEGRPLLLAWISSPGNLERLAELKAANVALARDVPTPAGAGQPLFVWFSFGVHGDEPAGSEAALELAYHLAASRDPATRAWLERIVVVIDPTLNPDGRERYVRWYRATAGSRPNTDPRAAEHGPIWPSGRTNGLYFDLNRDWAWGVMPETRARWAAYLATLPEVHVDFHEMDGGSTYFFFPPADPVHPLFPASTVAWASVFGEANASVFARRGWAHYSGRDYDLLYPGYGDAWSSFHGATGMTYEQAGGGRAGLALSVGGRVLTLGERVEHHLQAALSTVAAAAVHRDERLDDFRRFWGRRTRVPPGAPAAYLVPPGAGAEEMARILVAQGIRVEATSAPVDPRRVVPLSGAPPPQRPLPAGTLFIPSDQPLGRYAAALLDPGPVAGPASTDISAWALPYLFGVRAYTARYGLEPERVPWEPRELDPDIPAGTAALAWRYGELKDVVAAARLVARGEPVQLAEGPVALDGRVRPRGTFVLPTPGSADRVRRIARTLSDLGVRVEPLPGPVPLAGNAGPLRALRVPRVALVTGDAVLETSLGAVRHLLARAGIAPDEIALGRGMEPRLEAYDAIVVPDGVEVERYARDLAPAAKRLEAWVLEGGTLVAVRVGAAALTWARGRSGLDLKTAVRSPSGREGAGRGRAADPLQGGIPGVLLAATIDTTGVLGQGFADGEATVMAWDPILLAPSEGLAAWRFAEGPPRAGRLPGAVRRQLAGRPYALVRSSGNGRVVLFADDPGFRGMLPALEKLYLNALLLLPGSAPERKAARWGDR